ncbi:MAG: GAF domain-containing protein [Anaerolineae bacterium]|nr:GAF domain-containing protein [Thermoflexus sp.]MDW8064605.1 GAF domain-containing protein [Anaerolineae bacterium]
MTFSEIEGILQRLQIAGGRLASLPPETSVPECLRRVGEEAIRLLGLEEEAATAILFAYDSDQRSLDPASRIAVGEVEGLTDPDWPRPDGMAARALARGRRVLSWEEPDTPIHPAKQAAGARMVGCWPLIAAGEPVGVLYLSFREERSFTALELRALEIFASMAALLLRRLQVMERLQQNLHRATRELDELRRMDHLLSARADPQEILEAILRIALELTGARFGTLRLLDPQRQRLVLRALIGRPLLPNLAPELEVDETSIVGWVAVHRRSLRISDLHDSPWASIYRPWLAGHEIRSELAVPLIGAGGEVEGVLNLESPEPGAFTEGDQRLLEMLAARAVIALQEMRLLRGMQEITGQLLHGGREALFARAVALACELIQASDGAIWLIPPAASPYLAFATRPAMAGTAGLVEAVSRSRRPLSVESGGCTLAVPMLEPGGTVCGVFVVHSARPRTFTERDQRLLIILANQAALAVQLAEHVRALQAARERQAVTEAFAAIGDIAANLLHRLNNHIGLIPVRLEGLQEKRSDLFQDPYLASVFQEIESRARAALDAVREAMVYLRPMAPRPVPILPCLQMALRDLRIPPGIHLETAGLEDLPPVMAGEPQLALVFFNLLENAVEALGENGWIRVEGRAGPEEVILTVRDNGPGIPLELQERIFELDFSTKRSPKKLGFGLWWVKMLVQRFGGEIRVESAPGHGTAFHVRLPRAHSGP